MGWIGDRGLHPEAVYIINAYELIGRFAGVTEEPGGYHA